MNISSAESLRLLKMPSKNEVIQHFITQFQFPLQKDW